MAESCRSWHFTQWYFAHIMDTQSYFVTHYATKEEKILILFHGFVFLIEINVPPVCNWTTHDKVNVNQCHSPILWKSLTARVLKPLIACDTKIMNSNVEIHLLCPICECTTSILNFRKLATAIQNVFLHSQNFNLLFQQFDLSKNTFLTWATIRVLRSNPSTVRALSIRNRFLDRY